MRKSSFVVLFLFIFFCSSSINLGFASARPDDIIDTNALDAVVMDQMSKHGLPGVALAVIENGEVIYQKGYGVDGNGDPMTPQTKVFIGSQSKSFTALAVAQLAEQGKLDLNAPVQTYIPWFKVDDEEASGKITVNHLLHHTSGLSDSGYGVVLPIETSPEEAVRSLSTAKLTAPVGRTFQYFNMGYTVLAYLVELKSGLSFADYVQVNILTPLGMESSSATPEAITDMPKGHTRIFGFSIPAKEDIPVYGVGEGWIVSTASDMAFYAIEFMAKNPTLVSEESMNRILTPGTGFSGMGWFIYDNGSKIVHGGANQTFRTEVNLYPHEGRAFVLLTNQGYQVDHFISASQLTSSVEAIVRGYTPPSIQQGWSVKWIGWAIGLFVLGLCGLHTRNILALRGWRKRMSNAPKAKRIWEISISFLIPVLITLIVFWQVSNFYGNRFNFISSVAYMRQGMPDIFILMIIGTVPDVIQGFIKIFLLAVNRKEENSRVAYMKPRDGFVKNGNHYISR